MAGSEPKRSLQDWSGLGSEPRKPDAGLNPIAWLKNGAMPSLWFLARFQFALACVSIVAGLLAGGLGAMFTYGVFGNNGTFSSFQMIVSALTFSTAAAVMLLGAAVTAYLALRNDREASQFHVPQEPPPGGQQP